MSMSVFYFPLLSTGPSPKRQVSYISLFFLFCFFILFFKCNLLYCRSKFLVIMMTLYSWLLKKTSQLFQTWRFSKIFFFCFSLEGQFTCKVLQLDRKHHYLHFNSEHGLDNVGILLPLISGTSNVHLDQSKQLIKTFEPQMVMCSTSN